MAGRIAEDTCCGDTCCEDCGCCGGPLLLTR